MGQLCGVKRKRTGKLRPGSLRKGQRPGMGDGWDKRALSLRFQPKAGIYTLSHPGDGNLQVDKDRITQATTKPTLLLTSWVNQDRWLGLFEPLFSFIKWDDNSTVSALAAITKYHKPGGLNNKFICHIFGDWKPEIRVLAESDSGEVAFPGLQMSPLHWVLTWWRERGLWSLPLLIRTLIPSAGDPPSWQPSSKPNHLLKAPLPNTITLGVGWGFKIWIWGAQTFSP